MKIDEKEISEKIDGILNGTWGFVKDLTRLTLIVAIVGGGGWYARGVHDRYEGKIQLPDKVILRAGGEELVIGNRAYDKDPNSNPDNDPNKFIIYNKYHGPIIYSF